MRLYSVALCSICCALLYGNALAETGTLLDNEKHDFTDIKSERGDLKRSDSNATLYEESINSEKTASKADSNEDEKKADESKPSKRSSVIEKIKDTQQVSSDRYEKSRELAPKWFAAAESGDLEAMKSVYEDPFFDNTHGFKFDIYVENDDGKTALEVAITNGRCNVVEWLDSVIQEYEKKMGGHRFNLRSENKDGKPMMIVAVENGHEDIVKYMLSQVMDPDIYTDNISRNWRTPLMVAAEKGFEKIVNLLLTGLGYRKADPNKQDRNGQTALIYAVKKGKADVVKLLLEHGANTEIKDKSKKTALMYAVENGDLDMARLLLDHGAKIDRTGEKNKTVVDYATGNEKMTKLLMGYANRPENQKKVSALKRVWKKVTKKTSDPRRTKSDSNLSQYDTEEISGLKKSESDPDVAKYEYDNVTDETSILTGSESTDSSASLYDDDEKAYLKNRRLSTDSTSTQYDNVTEKTGGLRRSESTDSNATLYENDIKTNQNIHDLNSSTDTIVAR